MVWAQQKDERRRISKKDLVYGELKVGKRLLGRQKLRENDLVKRDVGMLGHLGGTGHRSAADENVYTISGRKSGNVATTNVLYPWTFGTEARLLIK